MSRALVTTDRGPYLRSQPGSAPEPVLGLAWKLAGPIPLLRQDYEIRAAIMELVTVALASILKTSC